MSEAATLEPVTYADELARCDEIVTEIEAAELEYRAGNPIAARMHVFDACSKARLLWSGESA